MSTKGSYVRKPTGDPLCLANIPDTGERPIIIKPAQPFLDWLHQVDPTSAHLTLEDLQREPTIYLVPECDTEDQAVEYLGESAGTIFEEHLDGWYPVPAVWPTKRDLATFQRWFEFSFHSMIVDLCDDVLEHEEL